jgi:hypothetical protein
LKKRFGSQAIIAEWGYNIIEACKKHSFGSIECQLFYDILKGIVSENVYFEVQKSVQKLHNKIQKTEINISNGKCRGFIDRNLLITCIKKNWQRKTAQQIDSLTSALESDQPGQTIT